ncbi:hypothetical protein M2360_000596 [Rhizobium sp. SG_E_25_P2]|uniref:DUF4160 domain-containing protein n=1 Tax=Rhizobium sp. SG_E_25_P2 TaxID=2879942 RepID=UPI002473F3CF|nr:DUF4160 domain-containing protein [Rhizobium sp. SG_E_25_P2]MDH6265215.1 hypothetical protein [Rhizobium sp. SG_E_25_P2]
MRFVIYTDDHEPAHVHVYGDGEARIDILTLRVLTNRGMTKRDLSRALALVADHQADLIAQWRRIHG